MGLLTMTAASPKSGPSSSATPGANPFLRSSRLLLVGDTTTFSNIAFGTTINPIIPAEGFLEGIMLTISTSGGSGTSVAGTADAPWNVIKQITLADSAGNNLYNLDGYAAYMAQQYGALYPFRADVDATGFTAISTTTGDFSFQLFIPQRFGRDGLGCLKNGDTSAAYQLAIQFNASSAVYSTAPSTMPTIAVKVECLIRSNPPSVDPFGNANTLSPPANGTAQYWTSQSVSGIIVGANTIQMLRLGNLIRNHLLIFRDTTGARTAAIPTTLTLSLNSQQIITNVNAASLQNLAYRETGNATYQGVIPLLYTIDPTQFALAEFGDSYMITNLQTNLKLSFTGNVAGSLQIVTNDIISPDVAALYAAASA